MGEQAAKFLRVLRYLRSLKAGKLNILARRLTGRIRSAETIALVRVLKHTVGILMMCHLLACAWYLVGTLDPDMENRWPQVYKVKVEEDRHYLFIYVLCLQWVVSKLGFGDSYIFPGNNLESAIAGLVTVLCVIVGVLFPADILITFIWVQDQKREQSKQKQLLHEYLRQQEVSFELQDRVWRVIKQKD